MKATLCLISLNPVYSLSPEEILFIEDHFSKNDDFGYYISTMDLDEMLKDVEKESIPTGLVERLRALLEQEGGSFSFAVTSL